MIDVEALRRIERLARAMRYRTTRECITAPELDAYTDAQLAAQLLTEVTSTMEPNPS